MIDKIQGLSTFIKQQRAELDALVLNHMDEVGFIGQFTDHDIDELSNNMHANSDFLLFTLSVSASS